MSTKPKQARVGKPSETVAEHLKIFEELDFEAYSKQNWNKFSESHADDILVTYPDGHQTKGLKDHVDELKPQFIFAPDTKIVAHPIKFGAELPGQAVLQMEAACVYALRLHIDMVRHEARKLSSP